MPISENFEKMLDDSTKVAEVLLGSTMLTKKTERELKVIEWINALMVSTEKNQKHIEVHFTGGVILIGDNCFSEAISSKTCFWWQATARPTDFYSRINRLVIEKMVFHLEKEGKAFECKVCSSMDSEIQFTFPV